MMVDAHADLGLKSRTALAVCPNSADTLPAPTNPRPNFREPNSSNAPFRNYVHINCEDCKKSSTWALILLQKNRHGLFPEPMASARGSGDCDRVSPSVGCCR